MKKTAIYLTCFCAFAVFGPLAAGQATPTPKETREANLNAYVNMMRQDLKKNKVAILSELMNLDPQQAARFWPVYNEYDKQLGKLADERLAFIRLYMDNYAALTNPMATKIAMGVMDVEARRAALRKQYFQRMSAVLTPQDALRWLNIEAQIERLVDLQVLASLPVVETSKETVSE